MTTAEKIAAIEASDLTLAWDTCHKIYLLDGEAEEHEALDNGYVLRPGAEIRQVIADSCPLVFVHPWDLRSPELNIHQFTEDVYDAAGATTGKAKCE